MKKSHSLFVLLSLWGLVMAGASQAQGLRTPQGLGGGGLRAVPLAPATRTVSGTSDFIVAIVDSEPVTNQEVAAQAARARAQASQQGSTLPGRQQLLGEALEQLIYERTQLQWAQQTGLKVTEEEIDQLESDADRVLRSAMSKLFREEADVREVIKLKAIFELLETITDKCEDVANHIEGIVLENS